MVPLAIWDVCGINGMYCARLVVNTWDVAKMGLIPEISGDGSCGGMYNDGWLTLNFMGNLNGGFIYSPSMGVYIMPVFHGARGFNSSQEQFAGVMAPLRKHGTGKFLMCR